jgi:hypothetical protein
VKRIVASAFARAVIVAAVVSFAMADVLAVIVAAVAAVFVALAVAVFVALVVAAFVAVAAVFVVAVGVAVAAVGVAVAAVVVVGAVPPSLRDFSFSFSHFAPPPPALFSGPDLVLSLASSTAHPPHPAAYHLSNISTL